jgi:hypothetical protein
MAFASAKPQLGAPAEWHATDGLVAQIVTGMNAAARMRRHTSVPTPKLRIETPLVPVD